ncbi:MAG: DUF4440 domain-containing protein [Phycisphaerae bacterium]|nr:DUF4440 domain-containing protein [Phycisphaerae bacterium]MCZ2398527.1 DUF4440 domain-containing protein [Phycisphaerae bacterium]NUQ49559.1 DUF4440 domain-containing protein [Phycisphaerae bacterium]
MNRAVGFWLCVGIAAGAVGCRQSASVSADELRRILDAQAEAWNRGDLDGFMRPYWRSPDLTFSSRGQTHRGYDNTVARFRAAYPTTERMGRLTFDDLEVSPISDAAALVLGRWRLERADGSLGGNFSLVFRRIDGRWVIVHDHTSKSENGTP